MGKLSLQSYSWKCVLGTEIAYFACLLGGMLPLRNLEAEQLHHRLFEMLPGFVWVNFTSVILGAVYMAVFSLICAWYFVWSHNSSIV